MFCIPAEPLRMFGEDTKHREIIFFIKNNRT